MDHEILTAKSHWGVLVVSKLTDIYPMYRVNNPEFLAKIEASIREDGLINPLIVMPITVGEWKKLLTVPEILPPPEGPDDKVVLQIRCGNNRYYAAKNLGYRFVDTKRVYSQEECNAACERSREACF